MKNNVTFRVILSWVISCFAMSLYADDNQKNTNSFLTSTFEIEQPNSILVMLPINNTNNVAAKDYFYASLYQFLVERGYYVFPPELSLDILQEESAYYSEEFYSKDVSKFGAFFGADAVLFTTINEWGKRSSGVYVDIDYRLVSTKSSKLLFRSSVNYFLDTKILPTDYSDEEDDLSDSFTGLVLSLFSITANSVSSAATPIIVSAMKANHLAFSSLPVGKYWSNR